jgi:hypothetical protein
VYERGGGRCTFRDERGKRCGATAFLQFDHERGFARTREHSVEGIRLRCRAHNQHAAEQIYGPAFMEKARTKGGRAERASRAGASKEEMAQATRPGTSSGPSPPA